MKSNLRTLFRAAVVGAASFAAALSVSAYDILRGPGGDAITWNPGNVNIEVRLGGTTALQDGSTFTQSALAAMDEWNAVLGSIRLVGRDAGAATAPQDKNGINEIAFTADVYGEAFGENVLAVALSHRTTAPRQDGTYRRTECDILFNNARTWDSYRGARQNPVDLRRVAIHELGHLIGLDHPDETNQTVTAVMNSRIGNPDRLQVDDIDGGQFLYGSTTPVASPANDSFASAAVFPGNTTQVTGSSRGATRESGEPLHAPNEQGGASVWWRWTAGAAGTVTATTEGTNFDTLLGVYTGSSVSSLTQIAANDDIEAGEIRTSTVTFNAAAGTTYFFAVDGWKGESGSFVTLNLSFANATPPTITTHPSSQSVTPGGTVTFTVVASGSPTGYQWLANGAPVPDATGATLTLANVQASNAASYSVRVTGAGGSVTSNSATLTVLPATLAPQTVTTGFDVAFAAPPTTGSVRWQISTNGGTTWTDLSNGGVYSGVNTGTLVISGATASLEDSRYRYVISSGGGTSTSNGAALTVAPAHFPMPTGIAVDGSGNLFITDGSTHTVQRANLTGGLTLLGGSTGQTGAADGTGAAARFNQPAGAAVAGDGSVAIGDSANGLVRRITPSSVVSTLAGSSSARGNSDGAAGSATFGAPHGVAIDANGAVFVADATNHTIRRIAGGNVTTFAGAAGSAGTTDATGNAARFNDPQGVAIDSAGNLYVADAGNDTVRKISPAGSVTTFAGVGGISGYQDGASPLFNTPRGVAVGSDGSVYVADTNNSVIRKISPSGAATTLAGLPGVSGMKDGTGNEAWFNKPRALAVDSNGNVFVADTGNAAIRRISPSGAVATMRFTAATSTPATQPPPSNPTPPPASTGGGSSGGGGGGGGGGGAPSIWFVAAIAMLAFARRFFAR